MCSFIFILQLPATGIVLIRGCHMELIDELKKFSGNQELTPELFQRVKDSEKIMREIDGIPGLWRKLAKSAGPELAEEVYCLGVQRATHFEHIAELFYFFYEDCEERACEKGLGLARKSGDFQKIAERSKSPETQRRAIAGALTSAASVQDCCKTIWLLGQIEPKGEESFAEQGIRKGIGLAKNLNDVFPLWRCVLPERAVRNDRMTFVLAKGLAESTIRFPRKNMLRGQVDLCEKRNAEKRVEALYLLLKSIFLFHAYECLRDEVPKGQKRLIKQK